ncbi:MAG: hypothetical protein GYA15_12300 [Leptolinea sp.]|jgi:hypothetical protein|nr:hypothetical protein [Leptolinea sp.]
MIKKYWNAEFLFTRLVIPAAALLLYCVSFFYISGMLSLNGVNTVFVENFGKVLLAAVAGAYGLFFLATLMNKKSRWEFSNKVGKFTFGELILLLLPLTPIVQYLITNRELLSFVDIAFVSGFFILFSGLYILVIPLILSPISSYRAMQVVGLTFAFTITNMAILSHNYAWFEGGSFRDQLEAVAFVFFAIFILASLKNRWILYIPILVFFFSNSVMLIFSQSVEGSRETSGSADSKIAAAVQGKEPVSKPNIYFMTYDAYVPNETMLAHGIDNSAQEAFLTGQGFKLYPHTTTVYAETLRSLGAILNVSGAREKNMRGAVSGDGQVVHIFKNLGYETYGIFPSDFMFKGTTSKYDYSTPKINTTVFTTGQGGHLFTNIIRGVLLGEFRFDIGLKDIPHEQYLKEKETLFKQAGKGRSFVVMYTDIPAHSQNSGVCLPDETQQYADRLARANEEMRHDIQSISENDPAALIIIIGDHGPYLTKNCTELTGKYDESEIDRTDIQDRYAAFLAIKWPTADYASYEDITLIQDIFPAVLGYLYQDPAILKTKIEPILTEYNVIGGANIKNGVISGGINDGEPLFLSNP